MTKTKIEGQFYPKEFALRWAIPESSIYKAIAQLKKLGLIGIKSGRLLIEWITTNPPQIPRWKNCHASTSSDRPPKNPIPQQNQEIQR